MKVDSKKTVEELTNLRAENDKLQRQVAELNEENADLKRQLDHASGASKAEIAALELKVKSGHTTANATRSVSPPIITTAASHRVSIAKLR